MKKWQTNLKKKATNAPAAPPASPTLAEEDPLQKAAAAIKAYRQSEAALTKALKITESAEATLDVERNRLSQRDASLLAEGHCQFDDWEQDEQYCQAQRHLAQARSVVQACRQKVKAVGAEILNGRGDLKI